MLTRESNDISDLEVGEDGSSSQQESKRSQVVKAKKIQEGLRVKILVSLAWGLSLAFALPQLVLFHVHEIHGGPMCGLELSLSGWQIYLSLIAVSLFFIPALIILVCYLAIIVVIFNSSVQPISMKKAPKIKKRGNSADPVPEPTRELRSSSCTGGIINQAKIRTIKMTFLIVVVYILCWSPYFVFNLCQVYGALPATPRWAKITTFVQSLAPLNSAANPVIYGVFSTRICSYLRSSRGQQRTTRMSRPSLIQDSPQSGAFPGEYSSVTDTEDFRLTSDHRNINCDVTSSRVPLVDQSLTEADRQLLSLHVRGNTDMHEV
ncbi:cardioacceleratory peptide receptor [Aplysia californica]|uniref:Cardioacceleratory peptide receptor n=1 Tax=Aplysia californica TaxID=6500 RepID=A0ABM0JBU3_APLCA|nr:cardioacceleratory peptide receptor [Aplysia californica]